MYADNVCYFSILYKKRKEKRIHFQSIYWKKNQILYYGGNVEWRLYQDNSGLIDIASF